MLLERAELQIREGSEHDFAEAMREQGIPMLESVAGVRWVKLRHYRLPPDEDSSSPVNLESGLSNCKIALCNLAQ